MPPSLWLTIRKQLRAVSSKVETHPLNIPLLPKSSHRKFSPFFKQAFGEVHGGAAGGSQEASTHPQCAAAGSGPPAQVGLSKDFTQKPFLSHGVPPHAKHHQHLPLHTPSEQTAQDGFYCSPDSGLGTRELTKINHRTKSPADKGHP